MSQQQSFLCSAPNGNLAQATCVPLVEGHRRRRRHRRRWGTSDSSSSSSSTSTTSETSETTGKPCGPGTVSGFVDTSQLPNGSVFQSLQVRRASDNVVITQLNTLGPNNTFSVQVSEAFLPGVLYVIALYNVPDDPVPTERRSENFTLNCDQTLAGIIVN